MADPLATPTIESREPTAGANVTLFARQLEAIDELAAQHRTSRSDVVRQLLDRALNAPSTPAAA